MIYRLDCFFKFQICKTCIYIVFLDWSSKKPKQLDGELPLNNSASYPKLKQAYIHHVNLFPFFKQQKTTLQSSHTRTCIIYTKCIYFPSLCSKRKHYSHIKLEHVLYTPSALISLLYGGKDKIKVISNSTSRHTPCAFICLLQAATKPQ